MRILVVDISQRNIGISPNLKYSSIYSLATVKRTAPYQSWAPFNIPRRFPHLLLMVIDWMIRTLCEVLWWKLSRSVTKNLTAYRFNSGGWGLDDMKREIHSFPTMYIMGGGKWCRNGSKLRFSQKKWPKNSFFEGHKSGSTDFGGVWHPYFWRYRYLPHVFWKNWNIIFEMSYVQGVNLQ